MRAAKLPSMPVARCSRSKRAGCRRSAAAAATDAPRRARRWRAWRRGARDRAARQGALDSLGAAGAIGALARPGEPPATATAPTVLTLATPIDAPDFAASLGVQVSVLAHDGVQHAELHLNPAETGPVSIRIEVDGSAARVDFGADLAATRQAIERGLPELASALRDAGLTLTGGGVSQHAARPQRRRARPHRADGTANRRGRTRGAARRHRPQHAARRPRRSRPLRVSRRPAVWPRKASLIAASRGGPVSIISPNTGALRNPARARASGARA